MKTYPIIYALAACMLAVSCTIENDIDYPLVTGSITDFAVDGQLSSSISSSSRTVQVTLPEVADPTNLTVLRFSLSENASCEEIQVGSVIDLSTPMTVHVRTYQDYVWTIYSTVSIDNEIDVDAWAYSATFSAEAGEATGAGRFEWREAGADEWSSSPDVSPEDGEYIYSTDGLKPATEYFVRLIRSGTSSAEVGFTTEETAQLDNMSLDEWCTEETSSGKTSWYPAPDKSVGRIWDSANKGVLVIGSTCATTPETEFVAVAGEGKRAARMESMYPSFLGLGRFAAGNLLTGEFVGTSGTLPNIGAQMYWGTPFTSRPSSLKGYYAYSPETIDHDDLGTNPELLGQPDRMQILVMLGDWDERFTVDTAAGNFIDQENDPNIIAYGRLETSEGTFDSDGNLQYVEFNCPLEYRYTNRKPKYVIVNCCASKYGDEFTGAVGSLLYVDELEFVY